MRTNEIKFNLQQVNTLLSKVLIQPTESGITQWSNTFYVKQALEILSKISYFNNYTKPFLKFEQLSEGDSFILDGNNAAEFLEAYQNLKHEVEIFLDVTKILVPDENQKTISIKLPNDNFSDFVSILNFLDQEIRSLITQDEIGGDFKINNFDHDPLWITLLLNSTSAVKLMGRISWAGAVVYKKMQETKKYADYLSTLELDIVHIEAVNRAQQGMIEKVIEQESDFLRDVYFKESTEDQGERLNRIKTAIQVLVSYYEMGMEIKPSFYAADEVQALYPDMSRLDTIESHISKAKAELTKNKVVVEEKTEEKVNVQQEEPKNEPAPIIVENEGHNIMANKIKGLYDPSVEDYIIQDEISTPIVEAGTDEVAEEITTPEITEEHISFIEENPVKTLEELSPSTDTESNIEDEVAKMTSKIEELLAESDKNKEERDILLEITKPAFNDNEEETLNLEEENDLLSLSDLTDKTDKIDDYYLQEKTVDGQENNATHTKFEEFKFPFGSEEKKDEDSSKNEENNGTFKGFF
ncbi:MAG: hypothetical protein NW226_25190 [Microscillaceae bacterium]|nr:hypothetical protein [Microscillaceae bacterium]